jgi:2-aminoadipate transaminase
MNWNCLFARRTGQMKRSAVRELLKVAARPGVISFAGGLPAAELFPMEQVREAADAVLKTRGGSALQYAPTEGVAELRGWIAEMHSNRDRKVAVENVAIVSGAQQALDLIGRVLLDEGDGVLVENPTYLALLSAWRQAEARFVSLADAYAENGAMFAGRKRPKILYTIPNFQNPQGTTLSLEQRRQYLALAAEHGLVIVEDDPYRELRYEGEALPSLARLDGPVDGAGGGHVIYVGSFSKNLVPGLRVGYVIGPGALVEKVVQAKQTADLHTSTFSQYLVYQLVTEGILSTHFPRLLNEYRQRRDAMLDALQRLFPKGTSWTKPEGGMFLTVTLPAGMNAQSVLADALAHNVAFVPGEEFHLQGGQNTMRLNFTNPAPDRIKAGIKTLAEFLGRTHQKVATGHNVNTLKPAGAVLC